MKGKKNRKIGLSLNYTVMLLPHSQKKPIHFKTPVWTFILFFMGLLVLSGTCLFFAGSRHQLKEVQKEKEQLEVEWELLAEQKRTADKENEALKQAREAQEKELKELEQRTKDTLKELEALVERENQIRVELGLQQVLTGTEGDAGEPEGLSEVPSPDRLLLAGIAGGSLSAASIGLPGASPDFYIAESVEDELDYLQDSLSQKSSQYDGYLDSIQEKKEAEAAEQARKEALRGSVVSYALQFIGNRYVYGGNDPNTGVDCSGFTRYVLRNTAGVYLNRTAASQSAQGRTVSASEARPGDLVFYSNGSYVYHVAIYIGNGQVVHASNERVGITKSNMYYRKPFKIVNVLGD